MGKKLASSFIINDGTEVPDAPAYVLTHDGVPIISVYRRSPTKPNLRLPRK